MPPQTTTSKGRWEGMKDSKAYEDDEDDGETLSTTGGSPHSSILHHPTTAGHSVVDVPS